MTMAQSPPMIMDFVERYKALRVQQDTTDDLIKVGLG